MTEPRTYPVYATRRPDGADLEIARHHYEHLLRDLFGVLDERPELLEDLLALYADKPKKQDPHDIAQPDPQDVLAELLVAALPVASRTIRLYRGPLTLLADQLTAILGRRAGWFPTRKAAA